MNEENVSVSSFYPEEVYVQLAILKTLCSMAIFGVVQLWSYAKILLYCCITLDVSWTMTFIPIAVAGEEFQVHEAGVSTPLPLHVSLLHAAAVGQRRR